MLPEADIAGRYLHLFLSLLVFFLGARRALMLKAMGWQMPTLLRDTAARNVWLRRM